jgi:tetratricopeptide (TPR) repeat protein
MAAPSTWPASPFAPQALPSPEWLGGRRRELDTLVRALENRVLAAVIYGPRGIGKTALVHRFLHDIGEGAVGVLLDVRDVLTGEDVRLESVAAHRIARGIVEEMSFLGIPLPAYINPETASEGTLFREVLPALCKLGGRRLVIALDELDYADPRVARRIWRGFFRTRQFANPPLFIAVSGQPWSGGADVLGDLGDRAALVRLGALDPSGVSEVLLEFEQRGPFAFDPGARQAAFQETAGFPLFLVPLLDAIYQARRVAGDARPVDADEVHRVARLCEGRAPERVLHALRQAGPVAQRLLRTLVDVGAATGEDLVQTVHAEWKAAATETRATIAGLCASYVLKEADGVISIPSAMLRGWIAGLPLEEIEAADRPADPAAFAAFVAAARLADGGDTDRAIETFERASSIDPSFWRARWELARLLFARAERAEEAAEERRSDLERAESHLRTLEEQVPVRSPAVDDVRRLLCRTLVMSAGYLAAGTVERQRLCREILTLDPDLETPGARALVAQDEVIAWAQRLENSTPDCWDRGTRDVLRRDRCWQGVADHVENELLALAEDGDDPDRALALIQGVIPPLVSVDPPPGARAGFWAPLEAVLRRLSGATAGRSRPAVRAVAWEAIVYGAPRERRSQLLDAAGSLLVGSIEQAVRSAAGADAERVARLLREQAPGLVGRALDALREALLAGAEDAAQIERLAEPVGRTLAAFLLSPSAADVLPFTAGDGIREVADATCAFVVQQRGTAPLAMSSQGRLAWETLADGVCASSPEVVALSRAIQPLVPGETGLLLLDENQRRWVSDLLDDAYRIEERFPLVIPGLVSVLDEDLASAYRGVEPTDEGDRQVLIRVFRLRGGSATTTELLHVLWDKERRALAALSRSPSGRALLRFIDARFHEGDDAAVLVTAWPGRRTLRDRLGRERSGLFEPAARARLWGHVAALLESVNAFHQAGFIHRAIRPEVVYVEDDERREARIDPVFKLAHFEWSVYLRGMSHVASPAGRAVDRYVAPEAIRSTLGIRRGRRGESHASDLYALGLLLFECVVRGLTPRELEFYRDADAYGEPQEAEHRAWLQARRAEVETSPLDPDERQILLDLLHFDMELRPAGLGGLVGRAAVLAQKPGTLGRLRASARAAVFTTLTRRAGYSDPRDDPRCVAFFLRRHCPEVDLAQSRELGRDALAGILERELHGAAVHLNRAMPEQAEFGFPLVLRSRTGILFRASVFRWDPSLAKAAEPRRRFSQLAHEEMAYIEVARSGDQPLGDPIGVLACGVEVNDIAPAEVAALEFDPDLFSSWQPWFEIARDAQETLGTLVAARRMQAVGDALELSVEAEYEAVKSEAAYRLDSEQWGSAGKSVLLRSNVPDANLAEILNRWCAEDARFELAKPRDAFGRGRWVVLTKDDLDLESGLVEVPLPADEVPAEGLIRPLSAMGADALYRRRRQILPELKADPFLLETVLAPATHTVRQNIGPRAEDDVRIGMLDRDKRRIVRQFREVSPLLAVQGPPGTGKTTLAAELMLQKLHRIPHARILVSSQGHEPLDNLLERLVAEGRTSPTIGEQLRSIEIVRMPSGWRETQSAVAVEYSPRIRAEKLYAELVCWCDRHAASLGLPRRVAKALKRQLDRHPSAPDSLRRRLVEGANIVFATTNSRHVATERPASYDLVVVEEAARAYPIELLGVMRLAREWLLIGDHQQLPPYGIDEVTRQVEQHIADDLDDIRVGEGEGGPSDRSAAERARVEEKRAAFERIRLPFRHAHEADGAHRAVLRTQWRMHPRIAEMVSGVFYGGAAVCNPEDEAELEALRKRREHDVLAPAWLRGKELVWVDFLPSALNADCGEQYERGGLVGNSAERRAIVSLLQQVRRSRPSKDIAILAPYRHQVENLRGLFERNWFEAFSPELGGLVERVFTVDSFQGRQAGTVILSLVRNNDRETPSGAVGFLARKQRSTVMFSRAERLLIVFGCVRHFARFDDTKWLVDVYERSDVVDWDDVIKKEEKAKLRERRLRREEMTFERR